jgi:uncharacterized membrane protein YhhN
VSLRCDRHIDNLLINMKRSVITIIYFITGVIYIIIQKHTSFGAGLLIKALILPFLMLLFLQNLKLSGKLLNRLMFTGLIFSWAGDVILELSKVNVNMFVAGLLCFLMAHIMYFTVFITTPGKNSVLSNRLWLLLPVMIYGIALVTYLYGDLAGMKVPVIIYAIVILSMLSGAIYRKGKVNQLSYRLVLIGAILFVISDSAIAVNKFSLPFASSGIVIMSTYILAQYLIVTGYISQFMQEKPDQTSR